MGRKTKNRLCIRYKKRIESKKNWLLFICIAILVGVMVSTFDARYVPGPAAYTPLLSAIAKGESGGNYNAYFGNPDNTTIHFTDMSIADVLNWQNDFVREGNVSNAVGKYQMISPTLDDITATLGIDHNEKFDESMQDKLAMALIDRRGALEYVNNKLPKEQFAANLSKEWAALPKAIGADPHESYYSGDGVNQSRITIDEVYAALDAMQARK